ncbi:Lipoma HMGIC fusion partner-like 2 protein [Echinococcus granulosus]|uniref:Lipoma HMGIC fusion partner-like 2 protein n=1 Tax=Echinococcus granulosus TaxID=6210 RepID=W6UVY6_ECHGR|nr:Lipoma HMGIC fusion partner-like 2 protein [Echinococcus granulosus]EUB64781.1 Lipoma HMGIC fusion partner-like 2 protein [Echinococcus granulosus]
MAKEIGPRVDQSDGRTRQRVRGNVPASLSSVEMKRIVVSVVSLVWMLFSTSSLAFILISLFSNGWLQRVEIDSSIWETNCQTILHPTSPAALETLHYASPSLGPVFSCETACPGHRPARSLRWMWNSGARVYCRLSLWGGGQKPAVSNAAAWTGSLLLLSGAGILLLAHFLLCLSLCKRELCGRSVFQVTGLLQCVADLLLLAGLFAWPAGWASIPVQEVCGASTAPYQKGNCEWSECLERPPSDVRRPIDNAAFSDASDVDYGQTRHICLTRLRDTASSL